MESELIIDKRNMPYVMDAGFGERARIGLIVLSTDLAVEPEFHMMMDLPGVAFYESRLYCAPNITPDTLKAMEGEITAAARLILPGHPLDVVAYGCTSGAMMIGPENVHARIREVRPDVVCTTPMEATVAAFKALDTRNICLITPYAHEINLIMRRFLLDQGYEVPVMGSWNEPEDPKVGRISPSSIREAVLELGSADMVDTVFVSCTNMRVAGIVQDLEAELGKPVVSSNLAFGWHCLRLAGVDDEQPRFGTLFQRPLP